MRNMSSKLGELLVNRKLITSDALEKALSVRRPKGDRLGSFLLKLGLIREEDLLEALSEQRGVPFRRISNMFIAEDVIKKIPAKLVWHYKFMPLSLENNNLVIAISDPSDLTALDDIRSNLGLDVQIVLAMQSEIQELIKKYYGVGAETIEAIVSRSPLDRAVYEAREQTEDIERLADDASVIKLVNQILKEAIENRATDIHIESYRGEVVLRYRIDGVLHPMRVAEDIKYLYSAVMSRVKIMCSLDVVEKRRPQDGRAKVKIGATEWDLRISIIPSLYGEHLVIRILPVNMLFKLEDLGMSNKDIDAMNKLIAKPHGIIFLTGPTGSGKTTTLYCALSCLNTPEKKIVTIEDPVEYELRGITQIQVNPAIGLTFAQGLRAVLRHDPDIMMIGEARDLETAETAIRVALTGHLIFSTLHTNDAASGVTRLMDMGIEPYLVASSVEAFIAQRLVRRVKGAGYYGRIAIHEILLVNDEIKELIMSKATSTEIRRAAIKSGMQTLWENGLEKVAAGVTTMEEVMSVAEE